MCSWHVFSWGLYLTIFLNWILIVSLNKQFLWILIFSLLTIMVTDTDFRRFNLGNSFFFKKVVPVTSKHWPYHTDLLVFWFEDILFWKKTLEFLGSKTHGNSTWCFLDHLSAIPLLFQLIPRISTWYFFNALEKFHVLNSPPYGFHFVEMQPTFCGYLQNELELFNQILQFWSKFQ